MKSSEKSPSPFDWRRINILLLETVIGFLEKFYYKKLEKFYVRVLNQEKNVEDNFTYRNLVVFDVGANVGQTAFFFKDIFPTCVIYSFEPQPDTFEKLNNNIKNSKPSNVYTLNLGLSNKNGMSVFYVSPLSLVSTFSPSDLNSKYSIIKNLLLGRFRSAYCEKLESPVATLDQVCMDLRVQKISILKIDVEGHELEVLQGAREMIQRKNIGFIQLERQRDYLRERKTPEIEKILYENGYEKIFEFRHLFRLVWEDIYSIKRIV